MKTFPRVPPKMPVHLFLLFFGRITRRLGSNREFRALPEEVILRRLTNEAIRLIFDLVPNLDSINQELHFGTKHGWLSCYGLHRYNPIPDNDSFGQYFVNHHSTSGC